MANQDDRDKEYIEENTIVLKGEDGEEIELVNIADVDYGDSEYCIMQPVELGDLADDEVIVFEVVRGENGNDSYAPVEDMERAQAVLDEFYRQCDEELEDADCDCDDCDCEDCGSCGCEGCGDDCEDFGSCEKNCKKDK